MENTPKVNHVVTDYDLTLAPHVFPEGTAAGDIITMSNDGLAEIGYTLVQVKETDLDLQDQGYEIGQYIELPLTGKGLVVENHIPQSGADVVSAVSANPAAIDKEIDALIEDQVPVVEAGLEEDSVLTTFEKPTFYRGMEIMGAVEDVNHHGTPMKKFMTTDKSSFFISAADFNSNLE